jgi:hypothetical protein
VTLKTWIAIIAFPHPSGTKPYVLQDDELENVATFVSVEDIEDIMHSHLLRDGEWTAFNFETGETEQV